MPIRARTGPWSRAANNAASEPGATRVQFVARTLATAGEHAMQAPARPVYGGEASLQRPAVRTKEKTQPIWGPPEAGHCVALEPPQLGAQSISCCSERLRSIPVITVASPSTTPVVAKAQERLQPAV